MVGAGAMEELIRFLPNGFLEKAHVAVTIAVILLASGPGYRL